MDAPVGARLGATFDYETEQHLYPRSALEELSTALACFAAGFLGRQDCVWIAEAELTATCVDIDGERLRGMRELYPSDWEFVCDDVFEYARRRYAEGRTYDLVNLDPPTNLFERCADDLELWCSLAESVVVLGCSARTPVAEPEGWHITELRWRSRYAGGTYWATLERA